MNILQKYSLFFVLFLGLMFPLSAQSDLSADVSSLSEDREDTEVEYDEEATILEVDNSDLQEIVDKIYTLEDLVEDFLQQDSMVQYFVMYNTDLQIVPYINTKEIDTNILERYDVIKAQTDLGEDFTYIKEYVFNKNLAWDYIYERIYDKNSKLCYFVRRYNTYNSGCAEVAFEHSEYFYDEQNNLIKKTYAIYDSNNNKLELDDCWMEREAYEQYFTLDSFLQTYPIPTLTE